MPQRGVWAMTTHYEKYGKKSYEKNKEKTLERSKQYYDENKEKKSEYYYKQSRNSVIKSRYGIDLDGYEVMLTAQGGKCAICKTQNPGGKNLNFHIDHDHKTGAVRGLLCSNCNIGLGYFKDSAHKLRQAITYLSKAAFAESDSSGFYALGDYADV